MQVLGKNVSFLSPESYKRGLVWSVLFNVVNYGLRLANFLVIAFYFGSTTQTDIYFYLLGFFLILAGFFIMLNNSVIIPEAMRIRTQEGNERSIQFLNFFIVIYFLALTTIAAIIAVFPLHLFGFVSKFDDLTLGRNISLLLFALPLVTLLGVSRLLTDIFTSYRFFTIPMVVGALEGVFSILFIVFFHNILSIKSALLGSILAGIVNVSMLFLLMKYRLNWKFVFKWIVIEKRIWRNVFYAQTGNVTSLLSSYFPLYIMSGFGTGVVTSLNYAQQLADAPNKFITQQFSVVSGIKFNELNSSKLLGELNSAFLKATEFLLFLVTPVSLFVFFFNRDIIKIVFQFSKIDPNNLQNIAFLFKYLILLLPFMVINTMIARLFMATHRIKQSYWYQLLSNLLLIMSLWGLTSFLGVRGYPVTMLIFHSINIAACYFLCRRFFSFINYLAVLREFFKLLLLNSAIVFCIHYFVTSVFKLSSFPSVLIGGSIYLILLSMLNNVFTINKTFKSIARKYFGNIKLRTYYE